MDEKIPQVYIALRNAKLEAATHPAVQNIREAYIEMCEGAIDRFYKKEDVERWEKILKKEELKGKNK